MGTAAKRTAPNRLVRSSPCSLRDPKSPPLAARPAPSVRKARPFQFCTGLTALLDDARTLA